MQLRAQELGVVAVAVVVVAAARLQAELQLQLRTSTVQLQRISTHTARLQLERLLLHRAMRLTPLPGQVALPLVRLVAFRPLQVLLAVLLLPDRTGDRRCWRLRITLLVQSALQARALLALLVLRGKALLVRWELRGKA